MQTLLLFLAIFGMVFFFVRGFQSAAGLKKLTQVERKRAEIEEARAQAERVPRKEQLRLWLRAQGYDGDMFPFVAGLAFLYLFLVVALRLFGLDYTVAAVLALPASAATTWAIAARAASVRRSRFNRQLIELLELVAGQIEGGNGAQKALATVVPNMQEPMRSEMNRVLETHLVSKDLIGAIRTTVGERYPSRAMSMLISALEIDQAEGHAIGPALHQSASLLKKDFALAAEAKAEIAQTRGEFFVVLGIMAAIAAYSIGSADENTSQIYTSFMGLVALGVALANAGFGVLRFLRLLKTARGNT